MNCMYLILNFIWRQKVKKGIFSKHHQTEIKYIQICKPTVKKEFEFIK